MTEYALPRPGRRLSPAAALLTSRLRRLERGSLELRFAGGETETIRGSTPGPHAELSVAHPSRLLIRLLAGRDLGFAEGYLAGDWHSENLFALLQLLASNEASLAPGGDGLRAPIDRLRHRLRRNSRRGSRRNIEAHYDLGNGFYGLWLDETWSYSSARFAHPGEALMQAQRRKYRLHLDALDARPGDHVLEIGCGWGGFALEAAQRGLRVTGITLSPAQLELGRRRVREAGLGHLVELHLRDYRQLQGQFDHVVSIEMFEAVGEAYWDEYFTTIARVLRPGGRASLQVITLENSRFERYRRRADFIQRHVFPGGMLPSPAELARGAARAGLTTVTTDGFGLDYAHTLRHWSRRVRLEESAVRALGFDDRFLRLWSYYLAYCHAGFVSGRTNVLHAVLAHADRGG